MKIREIDIEDDFKFECFELNKARSTRENIGLKACYLLACHPDIQFESLELVAQDEDIGMQPEWDVDYEEDFFVLSYPTLESFLEEYDEDDFGSWKFIGEYNGVDVTFFGRRSDTEIGTSYPKEEMIDLEPLMVEIESMIQ